MKRNVNENVIATKGITFSECVNTLLSLDSVTIFDKVGKLDEYNRKCNAFAKFVTETLTAFFDDGFTNLVNSESFSNKKSAEEKSRLRASLVGVVDASQIEAIVNAASGKSQKQITLQKKWCFAKSQLSDKTFLSALEFTKFVQTCFDSYSESANEDKKRDYINERVKSAKESFVSVLGRELTKDESERIDADTRTKVAQEIADGKVKF